MFDLINNFVLTQQWELIYILLHTQCMSFHEAQDYISGKLSKQKGDFALISEAGKDVILKFKDTKVTSRRSSRDSLRAVFSRGEKVKILDFNLKGDLDAQIKKLTKGLKKDPHFKGVLESSKYRKIIDIHGFQQNLYL